MLAGNQRECRKPECACCVEQRCLQAKAIQVRDVRDVCHVPRCPCNFHQRAVVMACKTGGLPLQLSMVQRVGVSPLAVTGVQVVPYMSD